MKTMVLFVLLFINIGFSQEKSSIEREELEKIELLLREVIEDDPGAQKSLGLKLTIRKKKTLALVEEALGIIGVLYIVNHVEEGSHGAKFILGMMFCRGIEVSQSFDAAKTLLKDTSRMVLKMLPKEDRKNCLPR